MANSPPLNQQPIAPNLRDLFNLFRRELMLAFFCHHVGTIQDFDATNQTATITINYQKTIYQQNPVTNAWEPTLQSYGEFPDCPVITLGGSNAALTMPIKKGDECLVIFNDRDIDNWFQGSATSPNATGRLHSSADAIVIVGLRSLPNVLEDYDTDRAVLRNGNALIGVGEELIKIANEMTSLKEIINGLIDVIKALVTVGSATTQTISPTSQAQLEAYKATVEELLE